MDLRDPNVLWYRVEENGRLSEPERGVPDHAGKKGLLPPFLLHEEMTTD